MSEHSNPANVSLAILQQQYKYLEERMKLFEFKMEEIAGAVNKNSMALEEFRIDSHASQRASQQASDNILAQLKDIQQVLQQMSSLHIETNADSEGSHQAKFGSTISNSAQAANNEQGVTNSKFGCNAQQMNEASKNGPNHSLKLPDFPSDKTLERGSELCNKTLDSQSLNRNSPISVSSDEALDNLPQNAQIHFGDARKSDGGYSYVGHIQVASEDDDCCIIPTPNVISRSEVQSGMSFGRKDLPDTIRPFNGARKKSSLEKPNETSTPPKCIVRVSKNGLLFDGVKLFDWKQNTRVVSLVGHGKLKIVKEGPLLSLKFTSSGNGQTLTYWMKKDAKFNIVKGSPQSVMFHCQESARDNTPILFLLASFPDKKFAEILFQFFSESLTPVPSS